LTAVSSNIYKYFSSLYGEDAANNYIKYIGEEPELYIRGNSIKKDCSSLPKLLKKYYDIDLEEIMGMPGSFRVVKGGSIISKTVEHINGLYYMQGLSSMIPPIVLNPSGDDVVLDLCAAPGSKTTQLAALMGNRGTIAANEISMERLKVLAYNIDRMNVVNTGIVHTKGEWLSKRYSSYFDKVLVDAPCSGLGIIQKKGEVNNWWSVERANNLGELQLKLLVGAVKMTKPGGEIVYSTCTLAVEENEAVIDKVLQKYPVELVEIELPVAAHDAFTEYEGLKFSSEIRKGKRIIPWEARSDGFFIVKLRKVDDTTNPDPAEIRGKDIKLLDYGSRELKNLFKNLKVDFGIDEEILRGYNYILKNNDIGFVSNSFEDQNPGAFERLGIKFGVIDKRGEITLHTNAAQVLENYISKNVYELEDQEELKKYMEGGTIKKDIGIAGQCVVKYHGFIMGTAVAGGQGIKSRFPRAKRTQGITFEY
jgi:NOL1/NOP2/sun family putative RNA methylase